VTYWGTAASTAATLEISGMIETATQRKHAECSADQHGKCKSRWDTVSMRMCGKEEHMEGRGIENRSGKMGTKIEGTFEQVRLHLKLQVTT